LPGGRTSEPFGLAGRNAGLLDYWEETAQGRYKLSNLRLGMVGAHQAANASTAIAAINQLRARGWSVGDDAIRSGLASARCPGRIEQLASQPAVILDVSHNVASIEALLDVLNQSAATGRRILIFASSKDKDYEGMLRLLVPAFDVVIVTRYVDNPRAMEPESLLEIAQRRRAQPPCDGAPRAVALHATARPAEALRLARLIAGPDDLIAIAGSFFLAAELRPLVMESKVERVPA
jgi:dihydrofolate synthase / folylpolyglutamate synthase